jgi:hypothetical protein
MSNQSTRTQFPAGDLISEDAVRGAFRRRRRSSAPKAANDATRPPARAATAGQDTSAPAGGARLLRRWSVAQLIARAPTAPRADSVNHC